MVIPFQLTHSIGDALLMAHLTRGIATFLIRVLCRIIVIAEEIEYFFSSPLLPDTSLIGVQFHDAMDCFSNNIQRYYVSMYREDICYIKFCRKYRIFERLANK